MKTFLPLIAAASSVFLVSSCDSSDDSPRNDAGLRALGIHSATAHGTDIKSITMFREIDGVRTEWMMKETHGDDVLIHIELGLPDKTMRLAIAGKGGAVASGFVPDGFTGHPIVFGPSSIREPDEYVLMTTQDDKLTHQNRILLIAK